MPKRKRRKFSAEQKADAVRLVRDVGSIAQLARDLDLTEPSLRNWVMQADIDHGDGRKPPRLPEFLRKAAAFFARDDGRPSS